jgi:hypothetical protein
VGDCQRLESADPDFAQAEILGEAASQTPKNRYQKKNFD